MVMNLVKWRPWSPTQSKKFEVKILVNCITGLQKITHDDDDDDEKVKKIDGVKVEIKWKGSKVNGLRSFKKRSVKKCSTRVENLGENGVVLWEEEFENVFGFCMAKDKEVVDDDVFVPWEVSFVITIMDAKEKGSFSAPAIVNLAEFASLESAKELDLNIPLSISGLSFKCCPSLSISLRLTELRTTNELSIEIPRPTLFAPLSPCFCGTSPLTKKDNDLRKSKSLTDYISSKKSKKAHLREASSDSKFSTGSDSEYNNPFDTDSFDDSEESESEESKEEITGIQKSSGYGNLVHVNLAGRANDPKAKFQDDELVYYSNKQLDVDSSPDQELNTSVSEPNPKFVILAWRKLSFKSTRVKGEPLLKKDNEEEGGDDIDFDRRQLSSDLSSALEEPVGSGSLFSEFGDDNFAVGCWEVKELLSRDGSVKLKTQIFFASIDQRSERAAGESACTALVAVIADWLHTNRREMPIKSDFDNLIREGSLQWRNLCENEVYMERFPDKHFDLETVLDAKIRPLAVVPEKSFIGFFHPEGLEEECFHFLKDSMSFDDIWDEICKAGLNLNQTSEPLVYVVSWNDHFFLLRVDWDGFYIIDTLGERLFEGNKQAFVLKFDQDTTIERVPDQTPTKTEKGTDGKPEEEKLVDGEEEDRVVYKGKECCKEYIKSFLAAIPIRELQVDMKKGLMSSSTPLHHRLQIEFNFTAQILPQPDEASIFF